MHCVYEASLRHQEMAPLLGMSKCVHMALPHTANASGLDVGASSREVPAAFGLPDIFQHISGALLPLVHV